MEDIHLVHRKSNINFADPILENLSVWQTCLRKIVITTENKYIQHQDLFASDDQILMGEQALSFLLEVLCGLHSPILGETEVFGQFKNFVELRRQQKDALFSDQQKWLQFIFTEVKKARSEFLVGIGSQSYGSLLRRYAKNFDGVTLCGSGHLVQEILPWIANKKNVQIICRNPKKAYDLKDIKPSFRVNTFDDAYVHGEALVIAAPLEDSVVLNLLNRQDTRPKAIYDLRGEKNNLAQLINEHFPQVTYCSLSDFFGEIELAKKETIQKISELKVSLAERALAFTQRTELRPLGWEDICA